MDLFIFCSVKLAAVLTLLYSQPQRLGLEHPPVYPQQAEDGQLLGGPLPGGALGKLKVVTHRHPPPGQGEPRCSSK